MKNNKEIIRQVCPTCKRYVKAYSRYPNYVCERCIPLATDKKGKAVTFFNTSFSGHRCAGTYTDTGKEYTSRFCYIKGVKCIAHEAYLGGTVILPYLAKRRVQRKEEK